MDPADLEIRLGETRPPGPPPALRACVLAAAAAAPRPSCSRVDLVFYTPSFRWTAVTVLAGLLLAPQVLPDPLAARPMTLRPGLGSGVTASVVPEVVQVARILGVDLGDRPRLETSLGRQADARDVQLRQILDDTRESREAP